MTYLLSSGEIVVEIAILVVWWLTLSLMGRRNKGKPMTAMGFAFVPSIFLIWLTVGCVLIVRGMAGF